MGGSARPSGRPEPPRGDPRTGRGPPRTRARGACARCRDAAYRSLRGPSPLLVGAFWHESVEFLPNACYVFMSYGRCLLFEGVVLLLSCSVCVYLCVCLCTVCLFCHQTPGFLRFKEHHNVLHSSHLLKNTCVRQVSLDKWFPLKEAGIPGLRLEQTQTRKSRG